MRHLLAFFAAITLVTGCGTNSGETGAATPGLNSSAGLTFQNVSAIAISSLTAPLAFAEWSPDSLTTTGITAKKNLHAVKKDGQVDTVTLFADAASEPTRVLALKDFVVVLYNSTVCGVVLIRKSDSSVFCASKSVLSEDVQNAQLLFEDDDGNLYFKEGATAAASGIVVRIILTDPSNPQKQSVTNDSESSSLGAFAVNGAGDVAISAQFGSTSRIAKRGGGSVSFSTFNGPLVFRAGTVAPNDFYAFEFGNLKRMTRASDGSFAISTIAATFNSAPSNASPRDICFIQDDIFVANTGSGADIHRIINSPGSLGVADQGIANVRGIACGSDRIYIHGSDSNGNSMIQVYVPGTNSWSTILPAGAYVIYSFAVTSDGALNFSGLRNSDGATILAKVAAGGGTPTVLSTSLPIISQVEPL